jgi:hypothetical protein
LLRHSERSEESIRSLFNREEKTERFFAPPGMATFSVHPLPAWTTDKQERADTAAGCVWNLPKKAHRKILISVI